MFGAVSHSYSTHLLHPPHPHPHPHPPTPTHPHPPTPTHPQLHPIPPKAQLEKLGMTGLYPKTGITEENLKLYLQTPPAGELTCIPLYSYSVNHGQLSISGKVCAFYTCGVKSVNLGSASEPVVFTLTAFLLACVFCVVKPCVMAFFSLVPRPRPTGRAGPSYPGPAPRAGRDPRTQAPPHGQAGAWVRG